MGHIVNPIIFRLGNVRRPGWTNSWVSISKSLYLRNLLEDFIIIKYIKGFFNTFKNLVKSKPNILLKKKKKHTVKVKKVLIRISSILSFLNLLLSHVRIARGFTKLFIHVYFFDVNFFKKADYLNNIFFYTSVMNKVKLKFIFKNEPRFRLQRRIINLHKSYFNYFFKFDLFTRRLLNKTYIKLFKFLYLIFLYKLYFNFTINQQKFFFKVFHYLIINFNYSLNKIKVSLSDQFKFNIKSYVTFNHLLSRRIFNRKYNKRLSKNFIKNLYCFRYKCYVIYFFISKNNIINFYKIYYKKSFKYNSYPFSFYTRKSYIKRGIFNRFFNNSFKNYKNKFKRPINNNYKKKFIFNKAINKKYNKKYVIKKKPGKKNKLKYFSHAWINVKVFINKRKRIFKPRFFYGNKKRRRRKSLRSRYKKKIYFSISNFDDIKRVKRKNIGIKINKFLVSKNLYKVSIFSFKNIFNNKKFFIIKNKKFLKKIRRSRKLYPVIIKKFNLSYAHNNYVIKKVFYNYKKRNLYNKIQLNINPITRYRLFKLDVFKRLTKRNLLLLLVHNIFYQTVNLKKKLTLSKKEASLLSFSIFNTFLKKRYKKFNLKEFLFYLITINKQFIYNKRKKLDKKIKLYNLIYKINLIKKKIRLILLYIFMHQKRNLIYYARYRIFNLYSSLIVKSLSFLRDKEYIYLNYYGINPRAITANILVKYISQLLLRKYTIRQILYPVIRDLSQNRRVAGFKITCSGRLTKRERASFMVKQFGRVPLSKIKVFIDYAVGMVRLRHGACGIKIWLHKRFNYRHYYYKLTFSYSNLQKNVKKITKLKQILKLRIKSYKKKRLRLKFLKRKIGPFTKKKYKEKLSLEKKRKFISEYKIKIMLKKIKQLKDKPMLKLKKRRNINN